MEIYTFRNRFVELFEEYFSTILISLCKILPKAGFLVSHMFDEYY